ncbi:MAG: hypothetical protein JOZ78_17085 [Chroococcidiopsidaceae cyanobacterium CP_BM_ER_R8_30]|nr:hypothetical protein [Chroococcidiopsidaceae cyanobacterium CP_BM_ER_R8_30]
MPFLLEPLRTPVTYGGRPACSAGSSWGFTPVASSRETPSGTQRSPTEGDPPKSAVSPPTALAPQVEQVA